MLWEILQEKITETPEEILGSLYSKNDIPKQQKRYQSVLEKFQKNFLPQATSEIKLFSTAGRTEILGNHTDHNLGKVLAGSINLDLIAVVSPRTDKCIRLVSEGFGEQVLHFDSPEELLPQKNPAGSSLDLLRGIVSIFIREGVDVNGFDAQTQSEVLGGSGLSSSAAFEIFIATVLNELYHDNGFSSLKLAQIAQESERLFFGKPCGLMDQVACGHGGIVGIDFAPDEQKEVAILPLAPPPFLDDYQLFIIDTGGSHADLTDDYAAIGSEMRSVAEYFQQESCRFVSEKDFFQELPKIKKRLNNDRSLLRVIHFFQENKRVEKALLALQKNKREDFFQQVRSSGISSLTLLQNGYSNEREQGVPLTLALCETVLKKEGQNDYAMRLHGGGFGGTIQLYVPKYFSHIFIF